MKTRITMLSAILFFAGLPVYAQDAMVSPAAPAAPAPALMAPGAQQQSAFPALPPSRPCVRQDVDGLWRLNRIFESPEGGETALYATHPYQYILFLRDDTYREMKSSWEEKSDVVVARQLQIEDPPALQQYLVHDGGLVYFYRDGVAIDTQVCFIVANNREPFTVGQMLLMPPEGQYSGRIVKVFDRSLTVEGRNESAQPQQKKRRKGKRKRRNRQQ